MNIANLNLQISIEDIQKTVYKMENITLTKFANNTLLIQGNKLKIKNFFKENFSDLLVTFKKLFF
ncbi:hypothetical protein [Spiroplasma taiwanense]|uniref:Uncharacterized protein n=1 Tax=Spiroplasma taiwanense CT-1 TaxID=1276220 RepID=S5MBH5_9MOLU|nr:hypothetical protein [Spiroplasma taiwanense]AGR41123.1 hypothetical protein STAIW_v1c04810 [Spiroplasma taiwanense CT-1]